MESLLARLTVAVNAPLPVAVIVMVNWLLPVGTTGVPFAETVAWISD